MKRESSDDVHSIAMANYLMLLSEAAATFSSSSSTSSTGRVFVCKTCNRQFSSFQALGGHRASHKKPRTMAGEYSNSDDLLHGSSSSPAKPKTHECSICGSEFAIGQALGGHMRRHRGQTSHNNNSNNDNSSSSLEFDSDATKKKKRKRVMFLDLNLTPLENDLEILGIGTSSPLLVTL